MKEHVTWILEMQKIFVNKKEKGLRSSERRLYKEEEEV